MTESFSTRLNDAMALRELKQIDFVHAAEKFNIKLGKSHMSQYVSGKTVPRADIAHFLAAYLRVNEDWLMGKDVPMEEHAAILPDFAATGFPCCAKIVKAGRKREQVPGFPRRILSSAKILR